MGLQGVVLVMGVMGHNGKGERGDNVNTICPHSTARKIKYSQMRNVSQNIYLLNLIYKTFSLYFPLRVAEPSRFLPLKGG